jgi:GH15 family glucan-1,4-alpha-glucosidase
MRDIEQLKDDPYPPIEDYGIIGDLRTTALVGNAGSIDSLCWPGFNAPSIFAAHVDRKRGGRFQIKPFLSSVREKKLYIPDTNILLSRFLSGEGIAEVSDFMHCENGCRKQALVRRAKCVHGRIKFLMLCEPRFNYGRNRATVECENGRMIFKEKDGSGLTLRLNSSVPLEIHDDAACAEFVLEAGEHAYFVLDDPREKGTADCTSYEFVTRAFKNTADFWRGWIARSQYQGRWRETVNRSALALKLMTSSEHGSIVAAPCFGFPNEVGGERNWDYRFTWIRDASFTIYALMRLGFTEEAGAFMQWLRERCAALKDGQRLQVMYEIDGRSISGETSLDHFEGYKGSRPVRVGSTNKDQFQLDIYGELMDSAYMYDKFGWPVAYDDWLELRELTNFVCNNWDKPDAGIWEVRSSGKKWLYSRVMCWVAVDRAMRLARKRSLPAPLSQWRKVRDSIYLSIQNNFWNENVGSYVQFENSDTLDASALIMPLVKFISPRDPRWSSTLKAITSRLVTDSLVYRYRVGEAFSDKLAGSEGTFSICSFWYIESIARSGDLKRARFLFEKMLSYGNQLGLFSEQLGHDGSFLGNIPQSFTHLALISTAFDLNRRLDAAESRNSH